MLTSHAISRIIMKKEDITEPNDKNRCVVSSFDHISFAVADFTGSEA